MRKGCALAPPRGETSAYPEVDKVVIFCDFFVAGLCFPLDPVFVRIMQLLGLKMHQLTPNTFVRLNLYVWLSKTCRFEPSAETFAYMHKVHHQPQCIQCADGSEAKAQFECYNFTYRDFIFGPGSGVQEQMACGLGFILVLPQGPLRRRQWYSPSCGKGN